MIWGEGPGVADPCPLPQTPTPNPLSFMWPGKAGAFGPAFPGPLCGLGGGLGEGRDLRSLALPQLTIPTSCRKEKIMLKVRFFLNEPNGKP